VHKREVTKYLQTRTRDVRWYHPIRSPLQRHERLLRGFHGGSHGGGASRGAMPPRQARAAVKATRPRVYARVKPNIGEDAGAAELFTVTDTTLEYLKEEGATQSSIQSSVSHACHC